MVAALFMTVGCIDIPAMNGLIDRIVPEESTSYQEIEVWNVEGDNETSASLTVGATLNVTGTTNLDGVTDITDSVWQMRAVSSAGLPEESAPNAARAAPTVGFDPHHLVEAPGCSRPATWLKGLRAAAAAGGAEQAAAGPGGAWPLPPAWRQSAVRGSGEGR